MKLHSIHKPLTNTGNDLSPESERVLKSARIGIPAVGTPVQNSVPAVGSPDPGRTIEYPHTSTPAAPVK